MHELCDSEVEYDEHDALQSGVRTFYQELLQGTIDGIEDEDGSLRILRRFIADKVSARRAQLRALKRDRSRIRRWMGGFVVVWSAWDRASGDQEPSLGDEVDLFQSGVPTAEVKLIADENLARLMDALDPELQTVAMLRLRHTIPDAASRLGMSESTYKRRLAAIREIWRNSGLVDGSHG